MRAGNVHQTSLAAACVTLIHPFIVFIETKCFYNFGFFFSHFIVKPLLRSVSGKIWRNQAGRHFRLNIINWALRYVSCVSSTWEIISAIQQISITRHVRSDVLWIVTWLKHAHILLVHMKTSSGCPPPLFSTESVLSPSIFPFSTAVIYLFFLVEFRLSWNLTLCGSKLKSVKQIQRESTLANKYLLLLKESRPPNSSSYPRLFPNEI